MISTLQAKYSVNPHFSKVCTALWTLSNLPSQSVSPVGSTMRSVNRADPSLPVTSAKPHTDTVVTPRANAVVLVVNELHS